MNFRPAALNDIEPIKNLRLQMLRELAGTIPQELSDSVAVYLEKHLSDQSCLCGLLEVGGEIVAMAMLCCYEEMPDETNSKGKSAKLSSVYTLPPFRGRGYMEQLLSHLLREAKRRGVKTIYAAAERKAISLYKRVGFQVAETILFMDL